MENNAKVQAAKMRSLMERMDCHQSYDRSMLNEEKLIAEATGSNRQQVTRDNIIDILNQAENNPRNNGLWASITYVKPQAVYKTKKSWRANDMTDALNANSDRSEEEWYKNLTAYNQDGVKGNNPVSTVVVTQRYQIHWSSKENYNKQYSAYKDALSKLRMSNGIGLDSDGMLGDNRNQRQQSDTGAQFNQTGNLSRDFNMAGSHCKTTAYFVDTTGHIISEIPGNVIDAMSTPKSPAKPEKAVADVLQGPALDAYMKAKAELDKKFRPQNLLFDRILCIAASVDGVSYYYINDALSSPIASKSDVNVNPQEMLKIAEEQLGESFDALQGFEK